MDTSRIFEVAEVEIEAVVGGRGFLDSSAVDTSSTVEVGGGGGGGRLG